MRTKNDLRILRKRRIRARVYGTGSRPRVSVFKSLRYIYAQVIDDEKGKTLASVSDREVLKQAKTKKTKTAAAYESGKLLAKKVLALKIKKVAFDRSGYRYHGRVKALAQGLRDGGLEF